MDYELQLVSGNPNFQPLRIKWDAETGTVSGPDAEFVLDRIHLGRVPAHPVPCHHTLSREPLKSREDMAAILGYDYRLPPDLAEHYPRLWDPDDFDPKVTY